jgi:hypothetical protein
MAMKRASIRLAVAAVLAVGTALYSNPTSLRGWAIFNWWNDGDNIVFDDVFLPAATWSGPAQGEMVEWNEVDVTDNSHPFRISLAPEFLFDADDGDNTMGFLDEAGLNLVYGLSFSGALAWTVCWNGLFSGRIDECDARPRSLQRLPFDAELRHQQVPARRDPVHGRPGRRPAALQLRLRA